MPESKKHNYFGGHVTLGVIGAIGYTMGLGGESGANESECMVGGERVAGDGDGSVFE